MSVEKAKALLEYLKKNPDVAEKFNGVTAAHIKAAAEELSKEHGEAEAAGYVAVTFPGAVSSVYSN